MRGRRALMFAGEWGSVTLAELAGVVDAAEVARAMPQAPEDSDQLVVLHPGGEVLAGHDQVARWLAWARDVGADPRATVVRVLLTAGDGQPAELRAPQPQLPVLEQWSDPLFLWGQHRAMPAAQLVEPVPVAVEAAGETTAAPVEPRRSPASSWDTAESRMRYTIPARDGAPAIQWLAAVHTVGGRQRVDLWRNGHEFATDVDPDDLEATIAAPGGRDAREARRIARRIRGENRTAEALRAKAERYRGYGEKAEARSEAAYQASNAIADYIPMGQPILVGHHSERRHRRDLERIDRKMRKSIEESKKAEYHAGKSQRLERRAAALDREDSGQADADRAWVAQVGGMLRRLKRDIGAQRVVRGFVSDAAGKAKTQYIVRGADGNATDVWITPRHVEMGVIYPHGRHWRGAVPDDPEQAYAAIRAALAPAPAKGRP